jgi:hypothetical protein
VIFYQNMPNLHNRYKSAVRNISQKKTEYMLNSPLNPLNQIKPNLAGIDRERVALGNGADIGGLRTIKQKLLKIEMSTIVHCCFSINQNELKF